MPRFHKDTLVVASPARPFAVSFITNSGKPQQTKAAVQVSSGVFNQRVRARKGAA